MRVSIMPAANRRIPRDRVSHAPLAHDSVRLTDSECCGLRASSTFLACTSRLSSFRWPFPFTPSRLLGQRERLCVAGNGMEPVELWLFRNDRGANAGGLHGGCRHRFSWNTLSRSRQSAGGDGWDQFMAATGWRVCSSGWVSGNLGDTDLDEDN